MVVVSVTRTGQSLSLEKKGWNRLAVVSGHENRPVFKSLILACRIYRLNGIAGGQEVLGGPRPMLFAPCLWYTGLFGGLLSTI